LEPQVLCLFVGLINLGRRMGGRAKRGSWVAAGSAGTKLYMPCTRWSMVAPR